MTLLSAYQHRIIALEITTTDPEVYGKGRRLHHEVYTISHSFVDIEDKESEMQQIARDFAECLNDNMRVTRVTRYRTQAQLARAIDLTWVKQTELQEVEDGIWAGYKYLGSHVEEGGLTWHGIYERGKGLTDELFIADPNDQPTAA